MEHVTRYRQELRYRTVTRYRTETRCCVTKTRQVYDHQLTANVTLAFPADASLVTGEKETFRAVLNDDGSINLKARQAIYTYAPEITNLGDGKYNVQMHLAPTYQPEDLGEKTIAKLKLVVVGNHVRLLFNDAGAVNKTRTHYDVQLINGNNGTPLLSDQKDNANYAQKIVWDLNAALPAGQAVTVRLAVSRDGIVIAQPVKFNLDANLNVAKEAAYDAGPYTKADKIHHYRIAGKNAGIVITFRDDTKVIDEVATEYRLGMFVQEGKNGRLLGEKTFKREDLKLDSNSNFNLSLANDFGIAAEELAKLNPGTVLGLSGEVSRYGSRFKNGKAVVAIKAKLTVKK